MNSLALLALLMLNGQETPLPQPPKAKSPAVSAAQKATTASENARELLETALDHTEDAALEAEKQTRCVQDKPKTENEAEPGCEPALAASQAQEALTDARDAGKAITAGILPEKDKPALLELVNKTAGAAAALELRARELANAAQGKDYVQEAYQAGNSARDSAVRLQTLLNDIAQNLAPDDYQDKD